MDRIVEPERPVSRLIGMKATPRRTRSARTILLLGFVGLALTLTAACGPDKNQANGSPSATPSGSGSGSPSSSPAPSAPSSSPPIGTPQSPSPGSTQALETHQGTVERGAEPACLILHASDGTFELVGGSTSVVRAGATVVVHGYREKGLMSHCMQGVMFKVVSAQAVS